MNSEKVFDKFNIMIIGDEKVGKTSILERQFSNNIIDISQKSTQMTEDKLWEWNVMKKLNTQIIKNFKLKFGTPQDKKNLQ